MRDTHPPVCACVLRVLPPLPPSSMHFMASSASTEAERVVTQQAVHEAKFFEACIMTCPDSNQADDLSEGPVARQDDKKQAQLVHIEGLVESTFCWDFSGLHHIVRGRSNTLPHQPGS